MTEEVKKALAWWREIRHRYRFAEPSDQILATLADAFAELHQPDDEPVTVEEGRQIMLDGGVSWLEFSDEIDDDGEETGAVSTWTIGGEEVFLNPTRGQLRRLIAALEE